MLGSRTRLAGLPRFTTRSVLPYGRLRTSGNELPSRTLPSSAHGVHSAPICSPWQRQSVPEVSNCFSKAAPKCGRRGIATAASGTDSQALFVSRDNAADAPSTTARAWVRLHGWSGRVTEGDVRQFLHDFTVHQVFMPLPDYRGRWSQVAIALLDSPEAVDKATELLQRRTVGTRYINLGRVTGRQLKEARSGSAKAAVVAASRSVDVTAVAELQGHVVLVENLPRDASSADVRSFFTDLDVVPKGILFQYLQDGRPMSDAYVVFKDEAGQAGAVARHLQLLGERSVKVSPATLDDVLHALQNVSARRFCPGSAVTR